MSTPPVSSGAAPALSGGTATSPISAPAGQQPVRGQDAHGVAVGPGPLQRQRALVPPLALQVGPAPRLERGAHRVGTLDAVRAVHPPGDRLDLHVVGGQAAQRHTYPQREAGADLQGLAAARVPRRLHMIDGDPRPGAAHPRLPLRQRGRGAGLQLAVGQRGRCVQRLDVRAQHPLGQHLGAQPGEGLADHLHPAARDSAGRPVVEAGGDVVLDQAVERGGLDVVAPLLVVGRRAVRAGDGPAEVRLVPLVPPAVEHRQVEAPVERGLHAAGAARLQGAQGLLSHTSQPG